MIYVIICLAGFFAAFVDSIVGGGGLISLPALMATGMPTHLALGTNKFAASFGSVNSSYHYYKSGNLVKKILIPLVPVTAVGAAIGTNVVLSINPNFLKGIIVVLMALISLYMLLKKNIGLVDHYVIPTRKKIFKGQLFAGALGFYDGFFGPGTGSFFIFSLIHTFGLDFKKASANARFLNMTSNVLAFLMFLIGGKVTLQYGIPMAISMLIGARLGTHFAIKKGSKFIKPIFLLVSLSLMIKMLFDLFH